jgi:hypothetical protein
MLEELLTWLKKEWLLIVSFLGLLALNLIIVMPRLNEGIPMGIDSTSHLFQIKYLSESFKTTGKQPLWCSYWYCGFPFLLFYPPLSYLSAFFLSLTGLTPVLSYKIIESIFFISAPFTIYFLARTLCLTRLESYIAALGFNLIPSVMSNFIFWDRYPTVISVPFVVLLSAFLIRYLRNEEIKDLILTTLAFSLLLLTHHFSAFCGILVAFVISLSYLLQKRDAKTVKRIIKVAAFTGVVSLLLTLFWTAPFISFSEMFSNNPFTNGDVWDNYMPPEHWDKTLYKFRNMDLVQWLFAVCSSAFFVACVTDGGKATLKSKIICASPVLFLLLTLLITPFRIWFYPVEIFLVTIISIIALPLLTSSIRHFTTEEKLPYIMTVGWFFIFVWLSFGRYALLFQVLPYWQRLDTYRFGIYACIPESILVGKLSSTLSSAKVPKGLRNLFPSKKLQLNKKLAAGFLLVSLIFSSAFVSHFIVADDFSYRQNKSMSNAVIEYFKDQETRARVLAIQCPDWVFLLPIYTGKPLVDGWYPQAKVLPYLVSIDDYTLNELIKTYGDDRNDTRRIELWRSIISEHELLSIEWVIVPKDVCVENETLGSILMEDDQDFFLDVEIDGFLIYKSTATHRLIETEAKLLNTTWTPDRIKLVVEITHNVSILVREAYFPEWTVNTNATSASLIKDENGFMQLNVVPSSESNTYEVDLVYQRPQGVYLFTLSSLTFFALIIGYVIIRRRRIENKKS